MVFESVLTQVLNRFLGDYVENLDTNQLSVGIWGGDVQLTNLILKQSALDELELPVQTTYGRIGKLVLKIPWKNLYGAAFVIDIEDIYLLAAPNSQVKYNPTKEASRKEAARKKEITKLEEIKKKEAEKDKQKQDFTFVEKLITQIIKNVQLNIQRIHIRYEDKVTSSAPFSLGITLNALNVVSTNDKWIPAITTENISKIFKIVNLDSLAVYWNCGSKFYSNLPTQDVIHTLAVEIASKDDVPDKYDYILGPINASARLRLNQKPELDTPQYSIPKIHLNLEMEKLFIGVSKHQYRDIIALVDSMTVMSRGIPYRQYKPDVLSYHGHYKEWWRFAYRCILEGEVRRQKNNWDWNHMSNHRKMCKSYGALYQKKLRKTTDKSEEEELAKCEKNLDIFNIVVIRQQIQFETERLEKVESKAEKKSWLGWMWGQSSSKEQVDIGNTTKILRQFEEAMTGDEKERLYRAIDYHENASPAHYPLDYIDTSLSFLLKTLEIELRDDEYYEKRIVFTELQQVKVSVNTRAASNALKVNVNLKELNTFGLCQDEFTPLLITSETVTSTVSLLDVLFETNPNDGPCGADKRCGQRLHIYAQPLKIVFDSKTIIKVIDIFKVPSNSALDQLAVAAGGQMTNLKEMSSTGLQFAIDMHTYFDLMVDLQAPLIIIPSGGLYTGAQNVFVVNLGNIQMMSVDRPVTKDLRQMHKQGFDEKIILANLIEQSYDNFNINLTQLQVMVAQSDEDWKSFITKSSKTEMHLLLPVNLNVKLSKCLITDDPRLPLTKITGELPALKLNISEARLLLLVALMTNIPLPDSDLPESKPLGDSSKTHSSTFKLKYLEMQENAKKTKDLLKVTDESTSADDFIQFTTVELRFVMSELSLSILRQSAINDIPINLLDFNLGTIEFGLTQQTYNTNVSLRLKNFDCKQYRNLQPKYIINTPFVEGCQTLFDIDFTQVNRKSPDFHSKHRSCEAILALHFAHLNVDLHQEGLVELVEFGQNLQSDIEQVGFTSNRTYNRTNSKLPSLSEVMSDSNILKELRVKKKSRRPVVETIKFKLLAQFNQLGIRFTSDQRDLSVVVIKGVKSEIIVKEPYTQINASLQEFNIEDLNAKSVHKKIISTVGQETISAMIVLFNLDETDTQRSDISIDLTLGGLRIVFLNLYVIRMLNFLNEFQQAEQKIIEASQAAAQSAKENMQNVYKKATRISLNIDLKAPDILIPSNSHSFDAVLLDLGHISITNRFITLDVKQGNHPQPIIDEIKLILSDLKLSRVILSDCNETNQELTLLNPLNVKFIIKRNLSTGWYRAVPDIDIFGKMHVISLSLSQLDYKTIMSLIGGNLAEGANVQQQAKIERRISESIMNRSIDSSPVKTPDRCKRVHTTLRFTFGIENITLHLFTGGSRDLSSDSPKHDTTDCLARFNLEGLSLKGSMLSDDSIVTSFLLVNCFLDDERRNREGKLNRLVQRSQTVDDDSPRSMIDVLVQLKKNDIFIDVKIYSFTVLLSVDYLMRIANFFQLDPGTVPETKKAVQSKALKATQKGKAIMDAPESQITFNLKVEKPDIILVEHMDDINTSCLICNTEILGKVRISGKHQVLSGTIKDFQMFTCVYNPDKRLETRCDVLESLTISLAGSTPENRGMNVELLVTKISLNVSPATIGLLASVSQTATATDVVDINSDDSINDFTSLWHIKPLVESDYWFFKSEEGIEVTEANIIVKPTAQKELCIISIPSITVTLEAGIGNKTLPMLILDSSLKGTVRNWSSQLSVEASLTLQMGYYNAKLAIWEPLIEPIEVLTNKERTFVPWELKLDLSMNEQEDLLELSQCEIVDKPPVMAIDLSSDKDLEITISKTCLEVVNNLSKAFTSAFKVDKLESRAIEAEAPFKIVNDLGRSILIMLKNSSFDLYHGGDGDASEIVLECGATVGLQVKAEREEHLYKTNRDKANINHILCITVDGIDTMLILPVSRADKRYFPLNFHDDQNNIGVVSDIIIDEGVTIVTLRSILKVYNHFDLPVEIYYMRTSGNELESVATISPKSSFNLPLSAVYTVTNELFFSVEGYSVTTTPYVWKDLQFNLEKKLMLKCTSKSLHDEQPFIISTFGKIEQVYLESTARYTIGSTCCNIHLRPPIKFKNLLPFEVIFCVEKVEGETIVGVGETINLPKVDPDNGCVVLRLANYLEREWSTRQELTSNPNEFYVWTFYSYGTVKTALNLGMHIVNVDGMIQMSLYCPFWMLNKTGLTLSYRNSDETNNVLHHPSTFKGPILFSFNVKNFFGKKKASIRIEQGEWSDKFSLDVAGSSGVVACKYNYNLYEIGVQNQITYNGLTKQITFTPRYVIINNTGHSIEFQENDRPGDKWLQVNPSSCVALWPKSELDDKLIKLRVVGTNEISAPFLYTEMHVTLLKLKNRHGGINIDIQKTEGGSLISLADYDEGMAPALILNHTRDAMNFWEKETVQIKTLPSNSCMLYTWENPSGPRAIAWDIGHKKELDNELKNDGIGEYKVAENYSIFWVSFLNGMQRILLFTEIQQIVENAQASRLFELINQEITISIHGVGISFVNNHMRKEIMYIGIASSGIIWEEAKGKDKRYKQLSTKLSCMIEDCYQRHLNDEFNQTQYIIDAKTEIDFKTNLMTRPHKRVIRRTFQTGLWLQMKTSPYLFQLHAKVNRLQIDNQLYDCIFPVVLAPVPLPKSVAIDNGLKPFAEVSIVQLLSKNSQLKQFKYFKVLIQEFHIKVDMGFITSLVELFETNQSDENEEKSLFLKDCHLVEEQLFTHVSTQSLREQKSFYDLLHFSPLKIHVSFSMASGSSGSSSISKTPNFLNVLLQGLGVTLTDLQDVVFKLAYFERDFAFLTQRQLITEATSHYVGQSIKQLYVLVLGLDVLGNPYGLVVGITKGVEDFFYEPFQGAIQGPGEFAEGIVLGVRSLFGHTVGGAAGAVSKITGAMGKGIAALTFDEDYQRKRRDQINKKPATMQEGIARSGKGLVMGVFDGVTGVFTKPISGAKEDGVGGFFKGLGKGAVGLVARPTAGVVDFASGSLDAVKRATEVGGSTDESSRLRPPRYMQMDGQVRPFMRLEAEGNKLLSELEKGKYARTDSYAAHYIINERKLILILTDKRVAYISHNDLFNYWAVDWSYTWIDIKHPPEVVPKGVLLTIGDAKKKKMGLFGSNDGGRVIIPIATPEKREEVCVMMENLRVS